MSASIFKAYDVRGLVDSEITPEFTFATGAAFARFLKAEREPATVVIGEDMRPSSPVFADAFSAGVTSQGLNVIRIGLASTDLLYFAAGKWPSINRYVVFRRWQTQSARRNVYCKP